MSTRLAAVREVVARSQANARRAGARLVAEEGVPFDGGGLDGSRRASEASGEAGLVAWMPEPVCEGDVWVVEDGDLVPIEADAET